MEFLGKTVVVTGAAGGFGEHLARAFVEEGAFVIAVDKQHTTLAKVFGDAHELIKTVAVDLLDEAATTKIFSKLDSGSKGIDILCTVAGGFSMGELVHETTSETWELMIDLNVRTLLNSVKAIAPGMILRGKGRIITVGANAAKSGLSEMGAYCAAKSAVMRITESMAIELRPKGVNVNCILPSIIDTASNRAAMPDANPKNWVAPHELSSVVIFLASSQANAISGASIPVVGLS